MVDSDHLAHLSGLEGHLRARIRGQDHLLPRLAAGFCRAALNVSAPDRPRASFLLTGPTGTGKSEAFTVASAYAFGPGRLATFDLSEYQGPTAIPKLLGSGPDDPGILGRTLKANASGALLFDELEKAQPLVLDLFLQILWRGVITVATGESFTLSPYVIGFTSNLGAVEAIRMEHSNAVSVEQAVLRRIEHTLRPELVGRIDEILVFTRLGPSVQTEICHLEVARELARLKGLGFDLAVTSEALAFLLREGFHPRLGARPLRKLVERQLQDAVVRSLISCGTAVGVVDFDSSAGRLYLS